MKPTGEALFERYHVRIYWYFRRVTGDHQEAQDLVQELFLRLVRALPTYEASGHETEWVYRVARTVALDYRRTQRTAITGEPVDAAVVASDARQVVAFGVSEALALLSEGDRDLVLLREVVGLTYNELSAICQTTPAAVSQRAYRIRQRLRELLGARLDADRRKRDERDERP